jgi:hypothetical protein
VLVQEIEHGGAGMIDIEAHFHAVKASWINRIFSGQSNWIFLARTYLSSFGKK